LKVIRAVPGKSQGFIFYQKDFQGRISMDEFYSANSFMNLGRNTDDVLRSIDFFTSFPSSVPADSTNQKIQTALNIQAEASSKAVSPSGASGVAVTAPATSKLATALNNMHPLVKWGLTFLITAL
jgi:hypothetical protein